MASPSKAERTHVEAALRTGESLFQHAFENAPIGMALTTPEGRLVHVNRALCDMLGYSRDELLDKEWHELTARENRVISLDAGDREPNGALEDTITPFGRRDGGLVGARVTSCAIRDGSGRPLYSVRQIEDVTDKLRLEQQLLQTQKMDAIGRIAGGVAHDFNNLLCVIKVYLGFTIDQIGSSDPARADLEQALDAADRAETLVRQLLAFSRKSVAQPKNLDLNVLVHETRDLLQSTVGGDVVLDINTASSPPTTHADPGHIEQVLINLVLNARDAMPQGGTVTIETSTREVGPEVADLHPGMIPGTYAVLTVSDSGVGIEPETIDRVFEPFFTTKERGVGTGLGLATVYGIVKQSNGYVSVRSAPHLGATFDVYLPVAEGQGGGSSGSNGLGAERREEKRVVLVVDDEPGLRTLVGRILSAADYDVLEAASGAEALELVAKPGVRIHAVVTDVVMPGIDGKVLADALSARFPGLSVLLMSGYPDPLVAHGDALEQPSRDYIQKPFSRDQLLAKLREMLVPA